MKTIWFVLSLLLIFSCKKEEDNRVANVHCDESTLTTDKLYLAATKLEMFDPSNPDKGSPYLSTSRIDEKYQALKAIENLNGPNRDSVFVMYKIPYGYYLHGHAQYIMLSNVQDQDLKNSIINSSVSKEPLRGIYEKYNLQFVSERNVYGNHEITIKTCGLMNVYTIANEIKNNASLNALPLIDSYSYKKQNHFSNNTKISVSTNPTTNTTEYDFSIGYITTSSWDFQNWRHWVFSVDKNGTAAFVKSYGDPAP